MALDWLGSVHKVMKSGALADGWVYIRVALLRVDATNDEQLQRRSSMAGIMLDSS